MKSFFTRYTRIGSHEYPIYGIIVSVLVGVILAWLIMVSMVTFL